jgi:hypothetical protein
MDSKLIQDLVDVGSGKLRHLYMGSCPDALEGSTVRDRSCPACKVLIAGARAAKEMRAAERKPVATAT